MERGQDTDSIENAAATLQHTDKVSKEREKKMILGRKADDL